jgi:hypothetical protein
MMVSMSAIADLAISNGAGRRAAFAGRLPRSSSVSRFTAGAARFLNFSQSFDSAVTIQRAEPLDTIPRAVTCLDGMGSAKPPP